MNRIIITLVTLASFIKIQAQDQDLTIKGDNFLYIDNTYLYVNKGINLQDQQTVSEDPSIGDSGGITNGSNIYLRGGAQLIQGDNDSENIGEGNVSIIVAGSANKWSYNYFGSPVSAPDNYKGLDDSAVNGQYYVSQIDEPLLAVSDNDKPIRLKSINSRDAEFTANWDSEQNPMVISSRYLFKLEEPGNWVRIDPERDGDMSNEVFISTGNGFAMKGLGGHDNHTKLNPYDFRGKPNNGTIEVNVKRQDDHLVLIGNPYPSILDIRKFYTDNAGKIESFRFWEAGSDKSHYFTESEGGYATMTVAPNDEGDYYVFPVEAVLKKFNNDGEQLNDETRVGSKKAKVFIPVGQGFIVELTEDTDNPNTKLVFNNSQRVYKNRINKNGKGEGDDQNGTGDFFRPGKDIKDDENTSIPSEFMQFRLKIGFNENTIRPLLMTFHNSATKGFDLGFEAKPMSIGSYDGLWGNKNNNYILQAFKYDDDLTIPLFIKLKSQSFIEFNSYDYTNIPDDMEILMHDLYTDLYYDLRKQNFSITLPAGDHENRFEIVFQEDSSLNQIDFNANLFKIISDNKNKKLLVYNPKLKSIKSIKLYDTSGKEIHRLMVSKTSNVYEISINNISNGVFIAQIETSENTSCSKRVIINK